MGTKCRQVLSDRVYLMDLEKGRGRGCSSQDQECPAEHVSLKHWD